MLELLVKALIVIAIIYIIWHLFFRGPRDPGARPGGRL